MNVTEALDVSHEPKRGEFERFMRFTGAGVLAAIANVLSRMLFSHVMGYSLAVTLAYLVGMVIAFTLSRLFVFDETANPWQKELIRFAMVNAVAFVQVWLVSLGLADWLFPKYHVTWHAESLAHMIGVASPIVFSYFGHKHFSFRG
jgi:putative flippase GtrA